MDSDSRTNDKIPLPHSGERVPPRYKRARDDAVKRHAIAGADRIAAFQSGSIHNKPFVRANNRQIGPQYRRYIATIVKSHKPCGVARHPPHDVGQTQAAPHRTRQHRAESDLQTGNATPRGGERAGFHIRAGRGMIGDDTIQRAVGKPRP